MHGALYLATPEHPVSEDLANSSVAWIEGVAILGHAAPIESQAKGATGCSTTPCHSQLTPFPITVGFLFQMGPRRVLH